MLQGSVLNQRSPTEGRSIPAAVRVRTVPFAVIGGSLVSGLQKIEDHMIRVGRSANPLVGQKPLAHLSMIEGAFRLHRRGVEAGRLGIRVGIERGLCYRSADGSRPPADAEALM